MCVTGEEGTATATDTSTSEYYGDGEVPEIVVTAERIGIDMDVYDAIDWTEVLPFSITGILGGLSGGLLGALTGEIAATLGAIESQDGIDLVDLVEIKDDMIVIPGISDPYVPLL